MANKSDSQVGKSLSFIREASVGENLAHLSDVPTSDNFSTAQDQTTPATKLVNYKFQLPQVTLADQHERDSSKVVPAVKAKMAAAEFAKRHQPMSMPKLHCFSSFLDDVSPDANKIIREVEDRLKKQEQRKTAVKKVRRMYHLSQSNAATTRRIMEKSENGADFLTHCPDVSQLISANYLGRRIQLEPLDLDVDKISASSQDADNLRHLQSPTQRQQENNKQRARADTVKQTVISSYDQTNSGDHKDSPAYSVPPLSMEDLVSENKIVKVNYKSDVWINYAN